MERQRQRERKNSIFAKCNESPKWAIFSNKKTRHYYMTITV